MYIGGGLLVLILIVIIFAIYVGVVDYIIARLFGLLV